MSQVKGRRCCDCKHFWVEWYDEHNYLKCRARGGWDTSYPYQSTYQLVEYMKWAEKCTQFLERDESEEE